MAERWAEPRPEQAPATGNPAEALEAGTRGEAARRAVPVLSVVLPLGLLLAAAAGAYVTDALAPRPTPAPVTDEAERRPALHYELPRIEVVLENRDQESAVYRLAARVALADDAGVERLAGLAPQVVDSFGAFLGALRPRDLAGTAGLERVREELRLRLATAIYPAVVRDVSVRHVTAE